MDRRVLAQQARAMVADGTAKNLTEAIDTVTRQTLDRIAGQYNAQAERNLRSDITRVERATRPAYPPLNTR